MFPLLWRKKTLGQRTVEAPKTILIVTEPTKMHQEEKEIANIDIGRSTNCSRPFQFRLSYSPTPKHWVIQHKHTWGRSWPNRKAKVKIRSHIREEVSKTFMLAEDSSDSSNQMLVISSCNTGFLDGANTLGRDQRFRKLWQYYQW